MLSASAFPQNGQTLSHVSEYNASFIFFTSLCRRPWGSRCQHRGFQWVNIMSSRLLWCSPAKGSCIALVLEQVAQLWCPVFLILTNIYKLKVYYDAVSVVLNAKSVFPGAPEVMGSRQPVQAFVGQDAILPCQVSPPIDVSGLTVEWKVNKTLVHVYRNRRDDPKLQHKVFRDRTALFHKEMTRGNLSLKLSSVNKSDAGNYSCFVPKLEGEVNRGYTTLIVGEYSHLNSS